MPMMTRFRELLRLDLDAFDPRRGLTGLVAIFAAVAFAAVFGTAGVIAGLAALFVIMTDRPGSLRARSLGVLVMTGFGAVIAIFALVAGTENVWMATLLTFVVTAAGTLAAGFGGAAAIQGLLLSVWAIVALSFGGDADRAAELTLAYLVGGLIAAVVILIPTRALPEPSLEEEAAVASQRLEHILRSPLGWFALLRATAVALAMAIGAIAFPAHPVWAAITVVVVMRPKAGETVAMGVLRTVGTLAGVVAAEVMLAFSSGEDVVLLIGFLVAGFGMAALGRVNYAILVGFLTALLVLASELVGGGGDSAAVDRLLQTILGAAIAFGAMALGRWVLTRQREADPTGSGSEPVSGEADDVAG
jgi:uncharacterized membrane protein YgaE (UPF0421/DUF939 family)